MENKKSFILYADLIKTIDHLTSEEKGILFEQILSYVNDDNPEEPIDRLILTAWKPIKEQLKRDLNKWSDIKSTSGRMGNLKKYQSDLYDKVKAKEITLEEAEEVAKSRKISQSIAKVAVNDNVNVTVNDNDIIKIDSVVTPMAQKQKNKTFKQLTEEEFKHSLVPFVEEFKKHTVRAFFEYWSEKDGNGKMKFQLNKTWDSKKRLTTWRNNESKFGSTPIETSKHQKQEVTYSGPFHK